MHAQGLCSPSACCPLVWLWCMGDASRSACNHPHAGVFMGFVAPWLGRNQSWVIFAFSIVLIVFSLTVLLVTAFTNPGFLPRNHLDEDEEYG